MYNFLDFIFNFLISPGLPNRKDFRVIGIFIFVIMSLIFISFIYDNLILMKK